MLKNLSLTFGTSIAILAMNILGGILTARLLGPTGKGELTAVTLWPSLLAALGSLGLVEAIVYFTGQARTGDVTKIISAALVALGVQSAILMAIGLLIIPLLMTQYTASVMATSLVYLAFIPLNLGTQYALSITQGQLHLGRYNLVRFIVPGSYVLGVVCLAVVRQVTVTNSAIMLLLSNLLGLLLAGYYVVRLNRLKWAFRFNQLKGMLAYGLKAYVGNLSSMMNLRLDQMLMAVLLAPRLLGLYVVAVTVGNGVSLVSSAIAVVAFPFISQQGIDDEQRRHSLERFLRLNLWLAGLASLVLIVVAPWLIPWLFGADYADSVGPTQVLALAAVVAGMNAVLAAGVKGFGRPLISTYGELAGLGSTALFLFLLLPRWQIMGAAVASLLAYSTTFTVMFSFAWRRLKVRPTMLLRWQPEDKLTFHRMLRRVRPQPVVR